MHLRDGVHSGWAVFWQMWERGVSVCVFEFSRWGHSIMESGSSSLCMDTSRHAVVLALTRRPRIHRYRANWVQRVTWRPCDLIFAYLLTLLCPEQKCHKCHFTQTHFPILHSMLNNTKLYIFGNTTQIWFVIRDQICMGVMQCRSYFMIRCL